MAVNNDYPVLDGICPSWADISLTCRLIAGPLVTLKDIKAINSGRSVDIGDQRGASGGRKMKRTTGQSDVEASLTLYRSGYQALIRAFATVAPQRGNQRLLSLVVFNINYMFTPPGDVEIYERRIKGCRIAGDTMNAAEGPDAQEVEIPLNVIEIADVIDGVEVVLL